MLDNICAWRIHISGFEKQDAIDVSTIQPARRSFRSSKKPAGHLGPKMPKRDPELFASVTHDHT
jgi:hypothetical protein